MESIRITPGFCPNCGSILPYLRANGNVKCYTCLHDWPPEGEFVSQSHHKLYVIRVLCETKKKKYDSNVALFQLLHWQCLAIWKPISRLISTHTQNKRPRKKKTKMRVQLWKDCVQSVVTIRCHMLRCSWEVPMKGKRYSTHAQIASKYWNRYHFSAKNQKTKRIPFYNEFD